MEVKFMKYIRIDGIDWLDMWDLGWKK